MRKLFTILLMSASLIAAQAQNMAHLNRYAADNAALPAPTEPRVVLMGDSITDFWVPNRPEFFKETGFIGRGIGGEESSQMLLRFRQDVVDIKASVVVILAGINDIACNLGDPYNEDLTFANIVSMADVAKQNGITPVLCSLLPSYFIGWRQTITDSLEKVNSLNARLEAYCKAQGITYVNYAAALAGPDGKILKSLADDTVHPNVEGYKVMEKVLLNSLK